MKILVTGGIGFIGKYLIKILHDNGHTVSVIDDFSNSDKKSVLFFERKGIKIFEGDIMDSDTINNVTKNQDIVIHLAAKISVDESIKNPHETFRINIDGTMNILHSCKKNNIKKIIIASSAAVYGEGEQNKALTEQIHKNPTSPYGESKIKMEKEVLKYCSNNEINFVILRFFNIYGIGQTIEYAGVITKFLERIKENKSIIIFGDGKQTRDFISVHDVIDSIQNAITYKKNGIFNIASGKSISINDLAKLMISLSGKELDIQIMSSKKGDIRFSQADISFAKKKLLFIPKIELKNGIKELFLNKE